MPSKTMRLDRDTLTANLRRIAEEAYGYAAGAPDDCSRGYGAGVEDLARLLVERDPVISGRLVAILRAAELDRVIPPSSR